jgi:hypothetical protein
LQRNLRKRGGDILQRYVAIETGGQKLYGFLTVRGVYHRHIFVPSQPIMPRKSLFFLRSPRGGHKAGFFDPCDPSLLSNIFAQKNRGTPKKGAPLFFYLKDSPLEGIASSVSYATV